MIPIYLDHNATTSIDPVVVDAMLPYLREHFGNPSSVHRFGVRAHEAVDRARGAVRLSVGRFTREGDVDRAAELLVERAAALQR